MAAWADSLASLSTGTGTEEAEAATAQALQPPEEQGEKASCKWQSAQDVKGALELKHSFALSHVCWHGRGDYFATVAPTGNTQVQSCCSPFRTQMSNVIHNAWPLINVAGY